MRIKSIKTKILLSMVTTVVIALTVVGAVSVFLNYSSTVDSLEQSFQEIAELSAARITHELNEYKNVAFETGSIARIASPDNSTEAKKEITDQRAATYGFQRGNVIGADGISLFDGNDYSDRDYVQKAFKGEANVSEPLISKITGKISIMIAAPLWEGGIPDTKPVGVIYYVPQETFLNDIVSSIKVSENGGAYIINSQGYTIADTTLETITTQNIENEASTDKSLASLAAIHGEMRKGNVGFGQYEINGVTKFIGYAPIEGTDGWSIGITAPTSDFMASTTLSIMVTISIVIVAVLISVILAIRLATGIGRPVKACSDRLKLLAAGDLSSPVPDVKADDETGDLAKSTKTIVDIVNGIIEDIGYGLQEMGHGNLTVDSRAKELYIGDFEALAKSMYRLIFKLTDTLKQIKVAAEQVDSGSDQVSAGAQALSQGATEQASSIEELAATLTEMNAQIKQNADKASEASGMVVDTEKEVFECNDRMRNMMEAMDEISKSADEIGKIIKTIEDIAFQTNILALNAAVEAARAGAAGKGFAVVAEEVRNLAGKSTVASKNTAELIEGSIAAVKRGLEVAKETASSLDKAVEGTKDVSQVINVITNASGEQAESVGQVTIGVDQISAVVQTNSATAEESAAASEELSAQARMLKDLMNEFRLRENTAAI